MVGTVQVMRLLLAPVIAHASLQPEASHTSVTSSKALPVNVIASPALPTAGVQLLMTGVAAQL
jgi:hypothetical protein